MRTIVLLSYLLAPLPLTVFFVWRQHHYDYLGVFHHDLAWFQPAYWLAILSVVWFFTANSLADKPKYLIPALLVLALLSFLLPLDYECNCDAPEGDPYYLLFALGTGTILGRYRNGRPPAAPVAPATPQKNELQYLRDQVNPHFLFNTLNSIYSLAKQQSEQTPEVVHQLSTLLRYQLETAQLETVSLRQELDFIQDYLLLEDTRLGDRCDIEFELSRQPARFVIFPMLLLPLVENAFKHGANSTRGKSFIHVFAEVVRGRLTFRVTNSRAAGVKVAGTGTGLTNLRRRLSLLYPTSHELSITDDDPETFHATLQLELHAA